MINSVKYTIIIPHYNDWTRLERLLGTIPTTRTDVEVIVIDDCSPDQETGDVVRANWPQLHWIIMSRNSGAGIARNVGMKAAKGKWLLFADSDDEFLIGAFEIFDRLLRSEDDLVYFLAESIQEIDGSRSVRAESMNEVVSEYFELGNESALQRLMLQHVVPWAKVYSKEFIDECEVYFDPVRSGNDVAFNVLAAVQATVIRVELISVYRVYYRPDSLTTDITAAALIARLGVLGQLNDRLQQLGVKSRMHAASYIARSLRFGPLVWIRVLWIMMRHEMFAATFRCLNPRRMWRFARRMRKSRVERNRLEILRTIVNDIKKID